MTTYIVLVIYLFAVALLCGQSKENNKKFTFFAFLGLFAVMALRNAYAVGIDSTGSYLNYYYKIMSKDFDFTDNNFAFYYVMKIINSLSNGNYQIYISVISTFIIYSVYYLVNKYSKRPLMSVMWFIGMLNYFFLFSALKQAMAMAILIFAFDAIMEKKAIKFYTLVLLAGTFHMPALIFLPAYFISKMSIGKKYLITLGIMFAIVLVLRNPLLRLMTEFYTSGEQMAEGNVKFFGNKVIFMVLILIVSFLLRIPSKEDELYSKLLMFMGVAAVLQTFCYYNNIFERLADYYYQFAIIFMPLLFEQEGNFKSYFLPRTRNIVVKTGPIVIYSFCVFNFFNYLLKNVQAIVFFQNYKFFWQ